jgi:tricorn protease
MADAASPAWDRDARHLYFLASTDAALGSGWANTSAIMARPTFAAYAAVLRKDDPPPFPLKSDEEADTTKGGAKDKDSVVRIDWDNLDRRIVEWAERLRIPDRGRNDQQVYAGHQKDG